ncbi:MAG TPA: hypothetical protein PKG52_11470 [bacterium]|nr:hypothetical protein [bacterium]HPS30964.1 hypothetical protein [bacterium]
MKNTVFLVAFFLLTTLYSSDLPGANNGWKLKKDHERFQVYVREKTDSDIDEVQVVALISGTIKEAYDIILDIGNYPQTFGPYVIQSEIVKKGVDCNNVYLLMNPPVIEKRETFIRLCTTYNSFNSFSFYWKNIPDSPFGKKKNIVPMDLTNGSCTFTETSTIDELQVICEASLDLGGSIPIFAINEINTKAIPQVIWQIYDEISKRREMSDQLFNSSAPESEKKIPKKKGKKEK